jgi:hypothetical protein
MLGGMVSMGTHGRGALVGFALGLAIAALLAAPSPRAPASVEFRPSLLRDGMIWLCPAYRSAVHSEAVERVPAGATTFVRGRKSYFVDQGGGWYAVRDASRALGREAVVTRGVLVLKSELFR